LNLQKLIQTEAKKEIARRNFWEFCKLLSPDFYKDDRPHLKKICDNLQALYDGRIVKYSAEEEWQIVDIKPTQEHTTCKKLVLNLPPQHGKSRTLINFVTWMFGKNPNEKVITGSYNDSTAGDFSRYTRDGIDTKKATPEDIVYSDIFPKTRIKKGNAGFEKWALEGNHFSYLGVGIGGSVTSKGGTVLIVDDPIKSAEDALNENNLERIWLWYTSTFLSRVSAEGGEPLEIVCMTRWSDKDIVGRILGNPKTKNDWYLLKMVAYDEKTDTMLCPPIFNRKRFFDLKEQTLPIIFNANYLQEPGSKTGVLFKPTDLNRFDIKDLRKEEAEAILGYIDVMDDGTDSLAFPLAYVFKNKVYITDVVFTSENIDSTLPQCVSLLNMNKNFNYVRIEANNQGGGFKRLMMQHFDPSKILSVKNTTNKNTRIIMQYGFIKNYFYFRNDYEPNSQYAKFMDQVLAYMKDGSSKHDDAPDSLAGLSKFIQVIVPNLFKPTEANN